jgi:hypothetical protein
MVGKDLEGKSFGLIEALSGIFLEGLGDTEKFSHDNPKF